MSKTGKVSVFFLLLTGGISPFFAEDIKKEAAKAVSKTRKAESTEGAKPKKIWSNAAISKMNVREYAKYEEEIDKAVREGRIQP